MASVEGLVVVFQTSSSHLMGPTYFKTFYFLGIFFCVLVFIDIFAAHYFHRFRNWEKNSDFWNVTYRSSNLTCTVIWIIYNL